MELHSTSSQAIELNSSCSRQVHSNRLGTGPRYENREPKCILTILCVLSIIGPFRSLDAKFSKVVKRFHATGTNEHLDLSLYW